MTATDWHGSTVWARKKSVLITLLHTSRYIFLMSIDGAVYTKTQNNPL